MRRLFQIAKPLIWTLLVTSSAVVAMAPQTGIYWNPQKPGMALYVESQKGTIFAVLYGYSNSDSEPEFYVASGPTIPSVDSDFLPLIGLYPIEGFAAPVYRVPSGPCLACPYAPIAPSERVGVMQLSFPSRGGVLVKIFFDDGRVYPNPEDQFGESMVRFNYALGGVPTSSSPFPNYFVDMRGEWVFTDQSDPLRPAWRFNFSTREDGVNLSGFDVISSVAFRDPSRNAVMYCSTPSIAGLTAEQRNARPNIGCELRQDGVALFWSLNEISIDEFFGNLGAAPPRSAGIFRSSQRVIGRRIAD